MGAGGFLEDAWNATTQGLETVAHVVTDSSGRIVQGTANAAGEILNAAGQVIGYTAEGALRIAREADKALILPSLLAIDHVIHEIEQEGGKIVNYDVARNAVGQIIRDASNVAVIMSPNRYYSEFLEQNPLTAHAFKELDKFSGGMLTSARNVSTLPYRAMRGDPIDKVELARDAIYGLQVLAIVTGGGAAIGAMLGNMVGREACKTIQHDDQKTACQLAFTIAGVVTGQSVGDVLSTTGEGLEPDIFSDRFENHFTTAIEKTFNSKVVDAASKVAVVLCKTNQWAGPTECAVLGRIAADYARSGGKEDWLQFLAREAAQIGVGLLIAGAMPPNSPERVAIERRILEHGTPPQIHPGSTAGNVQYVQTADSGASVLPWLVGAGLLAAAAFG